MLVCSVHPLALLEVGEIAVLVGASRYEHAQSGDARLGGRSFASNCFAQVANVGLPGGDFLRRHVAPGVFGEVVAAHEASVAHGADELLLAGVGAPVTRELVRAREPLVAPIPAAAERLLTCRGRTNEEKQVSHARFIKT